MAEIPCLNLSPDTLRVALLDDVIHELTALGAGVPPWWGKLDFHNALRMVGRNAAEIAKELKKHAHEVAKGAQKIGDFANDQAVQNSTNAKSFTCVPPIAYDEENDEVEHEVVGETSEYSITDKVLRRVHLASDGTGHMKAPDPDNDWVALPTGGGGGGLAVATADYNSAADPPTVAANLAGGGAITVTLRYRGGPTGSIEYPNMRNEQSMTVVHDGTLLDGQPDPDHWVCTGPHDAPLVGPGNIRIADEIDLPEGVEWPEESGVFYTVVEFMDEFGQPIRVPYEPIPGWQLWWNSEAKFLRGAREGLIDLQANIIQEPLVPGSTGGSNAHGHPLGGAHPHATINAAAGPGDAKTGTEELGLVAEDYGSEHSHGTAENIPAYRGVMYLKRVK